MASVVETSRHRPGRADRARGFTYLGVLLAIALICIGLMAASEVWVTTAQRERMAQLEWTGQQYRQAIASYYHASPGPVKTYPRSFNDLLEDRRFVVTRRHLRRLYPNPFTSLMDWEPVAAAGGGWQGVQVEVAIGAGRQLKQFNMPVEGEQ